MIHEIITPFVWLIIPCITVIVIFKIRTTYKIAQIKNDTKIKKGEETLSGSISKMLNDAPNQLKQIESEIMTIEANCRKQGIPDDKKKELLARLNSEKDMLTYATKYGQVVKPFLKPLDKIANKFLGGLGQ